MTSFLKYLRDRNAVAQITHEDEFNTHIKGKQTAYIGFDPTAPSLHVGNLVALTMAKRWQQAGHRIIILLGGGTAMVGDPTGKTELRSMAETSVIDERALLIKGQIERYIDFSDPERGILVNNADWLRDLQYLPFLREIGAHFNVNRMLDAECFKQRMEKGLSFLEFNYMIFQAYDFLELYKRYGCTIQLGGDDQWSNMLAGMDLVRKMKRAQAFVVTCPLLISSTGKKMGKTEKGALWLNSEMTSPFDLFQYFRNIDDQDVGAVLRMLTDLSADEITELASRQDQSINESKVRAAFEITKLVHGIDKANEAKEMAASLFSGQGQEANAPELRYDEKSTLILDVLVKTKACESKSEGRRLIQQGGLTIDGEKVSDEKGEFTADQRAHGVLVRLGKKRYYRIIFTS